MDNDRTFSTSRTLPQAPAHIYAAFSAADVLASWWGPEGFSNSFELFEFRVGGSWKFVMHGPDGKSYANESRFMVLEPNAKVVINHVSPPQFTLTVGLTPVVDGTHLTWQQTFENAETAQAVKHIVVPANEQNLDRLARALAKSAATTD